MLEEQPRRVNPALLTTPGKPSALDSSSSSLRFYSPPPHANFLEKFWPVKPGRIPLTGKCCAKVLCSVFAGVYNEFLIKGKGADIDIMIQNVFMYLDSIICNVLLLGVKGELSSSFTIGALSSLANPFVLLLIVNNAVLGIITSLFLQVT